MLTAHPHAGHFNSKKQPELIDPEIIVRSFQKCRIFNSVEGLEDSLIRVEIQVPMNTDSEKDDNSDDDPFQDVDKIDRFIDKDQVMK